MAEQLIQSQLFERGAMEFLRLIKRIRLPEKCVAVLCSYEQCPRTQRGDPNFVHLVRAIKEQCGATGQTCAV
jgi:hypothetical protein